MIGRAVLVQIPGNLVEVAADPAVLGCELPDSGEQFVIDRRHMEYGAPYNALSGEVRAAIADLAALKYEVLQKVGDAVGNTQTYQL